LAVRAEPEWQALCEVMAQPALAQDPRFDKMARRQQNREALESVIAAWTRTQDVEAVARQLQDVGVAAMPLRTVEGRGKDPHMQARQTHEQIDHPFTGIEHMHNIPWKLSETPPKIQGPAPQVGQHNDYVFGELLGLSAAEQRQLAEDGCL
jgi:crotonobetainyl-CoA:carnitine CoA-transferase CaiB-like acyl-CoA transferase